GLSSLQIPFRACHCSSPVSPFLEVLLSSRRSGRFDGNSFRLLGLRAGKRQVKDAVGELRVDRVGIDLERESKRSAELVLFAFVTVVGFPVLELLVLSRTADRDGVADDGDLQLVRLHAGKLGGQDDVVGTAPDVDGGKLENRRFTAPGKQAL